MEQLDNEHVLIVGRSGSGKTTAEVKELFEEAQRGDSAIVCIDPHVGVEGLAFGFFSHLCASEHRDRVLYDRLSENDRVLKWDFLTRSTAASPRKRRDENNTRCKRFAEILLRRRGKASAADTPDTEKWLMAALKFYIYQRKRRPLADIRYAFSFAHPTFQAMLDGCQDSDTCYRFEEIIEKKQKSYQAAEKIIEAVCESVAFQVRTEHADGFNFERHLENKGILIVEGGADDEDAMQTMMGAIILKTLTYLRKRKRKFPHVTLAFDEATNAKLIGEAGHEVKALGTLRKYGLGMHIIVQYLDFPSISAIAHHFRTAAGAG